MAQHSALRTPSPSPIPTNIIDITYEQLEAIAAQPVHIIERNPSRVIRDLVLELRRRQFHITT